MMTQDVVFDRETHVLAEDHTSLRLWLRLLTCATMIENEVRARLREQFGITLPRFDLMAQLYRAADGLKMSELSQSMMVSGANVTALTDQLEADGLVERLNVPGDRRAWMVRLTAKGRKSFAGMAQAHETWMVELMGGLSAAEQQKMHELLGKLKHSLA